MWFYVFFVQRFFTANFLMPSRSFYIYCCFNISPAFPVVLNDEVVLNYLTLLEKSIKFLNSIFSSNEESVKICLSSLSLKKIVYFITLLISQLPYYYLLLYFQLISNTHIQSDRHVFLIILFLGLLFLTHCLLFLSLLSTNILFIVAFLM